MASFRLGPLKSPNRRLLSQPSPQPLTPPFSIDPSQLQVSLEQTQGPAALSQTNGSPGGKSSSPLRGRCVKEYEEQLQQLQHENFNLKLRVFLLEERVGKALGRGDAADIIKNNIELKVETETLKKSLADKCDLLAQASTAIEELEAQQKAALAAHRTQTLALNDHIEQLKKDLADAEELSRHHSIRQPDESNDLYAQAFGSFLATNPPQQQQLVDELQARIDQLQEQLSERTGQANEYHERLRSLEVDFGLKQSRVSQLEAEQAAKDARIVQLVHGGDNERLKLVEEKQCQLEQQSKILVEIQITLDEKQKQIAELECALSDRKRKVEELEKSLTKAGRTLQGFVADVQKKDKELEAAKNEARKKDKRIKDLTAELKEAQEMLNKAKWEAETGCREDNVKAMAEEENERLWAELEEKKRLLADLAGQKERTAAEAEVQVASLRRQVAELQHEVTNRTAGRLSVEKQQRKSVDPAVASVQQQYEDALSKVDQLERELARVRSLKNKTDLVDNANNELVNLYKKEVTLLRQRLADSTNACDLLRTRLEEMADFLEEILSMSHQELVNLSSWTSASGLDKRRQALQQSIMQSRELSRSLSQSLMIGVDGPNGPVAADDSCASLHSASSCFSIKSSRERSPDMSLPPPCDVDVDDETSVKLPPAQEGSAVDRLRFMVAQLEVQQKDAEMAWVNVERDGGKPVSSTPYRPKGTTASESDAWSEPDRSVSFARIGLPTQNRHQANSIAALLSKKSAAAAAATGRLSHSTTHDADSSDLGSSNGNGYGSRRTARRSRSDPATGNRLKALEQENCRLRAQLAEVMVTLRSTYEAQKETDLLDDSLGGGLIEAPSVLVQEEVATARHIVEALQTRLAKMKDLLRRREQRIRETKDEAAQRESHFKDKLNECEAQRTELRRLLDAKETELNGALVKAKLWEESFQENQKASRQLEAELRTQQDLLVESKLALEQQVRLLEDERLTLKAETAALSEQLKSARSALAQHSSQSPLRRSAGGAGGPSLQRQVSQMSDYVSDQAVSAEDSGQPAEPLRPPTVHRSPDLGIDSDAGRFSSLEHVVSGQQDWNDNKLTEDALDRDGKRAAPDVLTVVDSGDRSPQRNSVGCSGCARWQNKYTKAKHNLAAAIEKLNAANVRKDKIDRALNKELGKTHSILSQARGMLEQANQAGHRT